MEQYLIMDNIILNRFISVCSQKLIVKKYSIISFFYFYYLKKSRKIVKLNKDKGFEKNKRKDD